MAAAGGQRVNANPNSPADCYDAGGVCTRGKDGVCTKCGK